MKLSRREFTQALTILTKVVDPRQRLPILANVFLEPHDNGLRLTVTDLEVGVVLNLRGEREPSDRPILLPVKKVAEIVKALPKAVEWVRVETDETRVVTAANARILGMEANDFPVVTPTEGTPITVPGLRRVLQQVESAMSHNESRYALCGVCLDLAKGAVVATDGYRLHRVTVPRGAQAPVVILPHKAVTLLTGSLGKLLDQREQIVVTDKVCNVLLANDGILVTRTIEAGFPNYEAIMPTPPHTLTVPREALVEAITTASTVAEPRNKGVNLILGVTSSVYVSNPDLGTVTAPIEGAVYDGTPLTISYNARYLLDALNVCEGETVTLRVKDAVSPLRIDVGTFTAVIMPLRV